MDGGIKLSKKDKQELMEEKDQRYYDAIALKEPDRVPIAPFSTFYSALQAGMTHKDAMYKPIKYAKNSLKVFEQYEWDQYPVIFIVCLGKLYDRLGLKQMKWPGAADPELRLKDNQPFQYIEKHWMEPEQYKDLLRNPTDFVLQNIVPAQSTTFDAMKLIPNAYELIGFTGGLSMLSFILDKNVKKMIKQARRSVLALINFALGMSKYEKGLNKQGNPMLQLRGIGMAPFDLISDMLRSMRGTMMDMYRNPEELKQTCELFVDYQLQSLEKENPLFSDKGVVFIPLHRGADGFMSNEQFEEFYWPTLTDVMEKLIARDYIPMPFFEGSYNQRLDYLEEFAKKHKRKMVYWFDDTDIFDVKDRMGDYVCIKGNVPGSLLVAGPPQKVEEYVKKSIEGCMEGGGYIVDGGISGIPDEAKHENVKAMTDAVHKYGIYRK